MTVPRAVACPRGWFPPATFQLRLRSLKTIIFNKSLSSTINGHETGFIHLSLHATIDGPAVWTSPKLKWSCDKEDRLEWSDIEIDNRNINLGLKSIIVKSWLTPLLEDSEPVLEAAWGLNFSGLWCLGTHPVANGRLPPNSFVFQICGSYFSSASYIRGQVENNQIPRFLHIGTVDEYQTVKSYDTTLLSRLHMSQRALKQQDSNNKRLISGLHSKGIERIHTTFAEALAKPSNKSDSTEVPIVNPGALPSLRQTLLARKFKQPKTRLSEQDLLSRMEMLRVRKDLLLKERDRRKEKIEKIRQEHASLSNQMEEKTSSQMHCYHNLSKEKVAFQSWLDQFNIDQLTNDSWLSILRQERLGVINSLLDIFPLMDVDGKRPTLRWTLLPPSDEIRECIRDDTHISVVVGDVAQLVYSIARIFDVPLRYPIRLMGSTSMIQDEVKVFQEHEIKKDASMANGEFPLYLKNSSTSEWSKFEYGLYLLNKNLAQLRWQYGLFTTDLRQTLNNLHEIMTQGGGAEYRIELIPAILTRDTPPVAASKTLPKVIIKNGKVASTISLPPSCSSSNRKNSQSSAEVETADDEPPTIIEDEKIISNNTKSEINSTTVLLETPPDSEESSAKASESEDSPPKEHPKPSQTIPSALPEMDSNPTLFWNDVTSRVDNLISKPSSFQRPRAHHF